MIKIDITSDMIENAQKSAHQMGSLKNSIEGLRSNLVGFLGEECFVKHYRTKKLCSFSRVNNYDFDFLLNGYRVEIKTKETSVIPRNDFTVNINSFNPHQEKQLVDFYFFVYLQNQNGFFTTGFMVGYISKKEFLEKSVLKIAGESDGANAFKFKYDCLCLKINQLNKLKEV